MLASVRVLPRNREPVGSRSRAIFAATQAQWLMCYLSAWFCVVILGLCLTSTGSFRASDRRLFFAGEGTGIPSAPYVLSPFHNQYSQFLRPIEQHRWGPAATEARVHRQSAVREHRASLATVAPSKLEEVRWHRCTGALSGRLPLLTTASGVVGTQQAGWTPSLGVPEASGELRGLSALFGCPTTFPLDGDSSIGGPAEHNGDARTGSARRHAPRFEQSRWTLSFPTLLHSEPAEEKPRVFESVSSVIKRTLTAVARSVKACAQQAKIRGLEAFGAAERFLDLAASPLDRENEVLGAAERFVSPLSSQDGLRTTCNEGSASLLDEGQRRIPYSSGPPDGSWHVREPAIVSGPGAQGRGVDAESPSPLSKEPAQPTAGNFSAVGTCLDNITTDAATRGSPNDAAEREAPGDNSAAVGEPTTKADEKECTEQPRQPPRLLEKKDASAEGQAATSAFGKRPNDAPFLGDAPAQFRNKESSIPAESREKKLTRGPFQTQGSRIAPAHLARRWGESRLQLEEAEAGRGLSDGEVDFSDMPTVVGDELLLALQGPPAQQALTTQALIALVSADLRRRAASTQACVALSGGPQDQLLHSARKGLCRRKGLLVNRLLHQGLVASLLRIITTPTSKPFWPRWLKRDVNRKQVISLLQLKLHVIRLLSILSFSGADVALHIAEHTALLKALESIATHLPGEVEGVDPGHCTTGPGGTTQRQIASEHSQTPTASLFESDGALREKGGLKSAVQSTAMPELINTSNTENDDLATSPLEAQRQRSGLSNNFPGDAVANKAPNSNMQEDEKPIIQGVAAAEARVEPAAAVTTEPDLASPAKYPQSLALFLPRDDALRCDTRLLRKAAERLALTLLVRLGRQTRAGVDMNTPDFSGTNGRSVADSEHDHARFWKSFLLPFDRRDSAVPSGLQDGTKNSKSRMPNLDELGSNQLSNNELVNSQSASDHKAEAINTEGVAETTDSDASSESLPEGVTAEEYKRPHIAFRVARQIRRFFSTETIEMFKAMASKKAKANRESKPHVFWVPLSLSAGDAGVWAALAAVAGEDLAAAVKRSLTEKWQTMSPQKPAAVNEGAGLSQLSPELLTLLQGARVESAQPSAPADWGVLGVTMEKCLSNSQPRIHKQAVAVGSTSEAPAVGQTEDAVLSGNFSTEDSCFQFRVLCLLTGRRPFQESVQTLGIRILLDAAAKGRFETRIDALHALTQLVRRRSSGVSKSISRELQVAAPNNMGLRAFEKGLEEALLAPYDGRSGWLWNRRAADPVLSEKLQIAALEFLYALCVDDEDVIPSLQRCYSMRNALNRVTWFCKRALIASGSRCASYEESEKDARDSDTQAADEAVLSRVVRVLPPGERHTKVSQEHARPLRLATIVSSALGSQPKWKPRVAGQHGLRILALDGGGTRGVLTVALLKHLAASVGRELSEVFDIICGTSTGGIIAILLGMEKASASELEALYDTLINEIFVKDSAAVAGARLVVRQAYYDERLWESLLQRAFGDTRMIDFAADESVPKVFCLSTRVSTSPAKLVVWRNYNHPCTDPTRTHWVGECTRRILGMFRGPQAALAPYGAHVGNRYEGSCCVRVRDALRATTAAPGFFIGKKVGNELYVDGALLANNPAAIAIAEAKAVYPGVPIEAVVSVGTGQCLPERCDARTGWDGIFSQLVNAATNTESIHELLKDMLPESVYFRFNPEIDAVSIDETSRERLDGLKLAAKRFFEDPRNKEAVQRLADILRPAHPLQKRGKSLVRRILSPTASFGLCVKSAGSRSIQAFSNSARSPVRHSDSFVLRLIKCCMSPWHNGSAEQTSETPPTIQEASEGALESTCGCSDDAPAQNEGVKRKRFVSSSKDDTSGAGAATPVKEMAAEDGALNLNVGVVSGGRRSFLAWLLRSPGSGVGENSSGIFDMLELKGRRHLSTIDKEEMETLVPLTGVRHVLHGIFELIRGQL